MPKGPLGFSRVTDIGPFVKESCFNRLCLGGHSKSEFLDSLATGFKVFEDNAIRVIRKYEVVDIGVSGSIARGDFGLRSSEKLLEFTDSTQFSDEDITQKDVERLLEKSDDQCEFFENFKEEYPDLDHLHSTVRARLCSDIDMVTFIDIPIDDEESVERELFDELLMEAVLPAEREIIGHMGIEPLIRSSEKITEIPVLLTEEEIRNA